VFRQKSSLLKTGLWGLCFALVSAHIATALTVPEWFSNPYTLFDRQTYLAAVGHGNSYDAARKNAIGNLSAIFGQDLRLAQALTESFLEAVRNGDTAWANDTVIINHIEITTTMENLMGAKIGYFMRDGQGNYFAVAVLERERAIEQYSERIRANQDIIIYLTSAVERYTFDGVSHYELAAVFAEMNHNYGEILRRVFGRPWPEFLPRGEVFKQRSREMRRAIPIGISVRNDDSAGRIQQAFAGAFIYHEFRPGGTNPRFKLDVDIITQSIERTPQAPEFLPELRPPRRTDATAIVRANFIDTNTGTYLLSESFEFTAQAGTRSEAERIVFNRAVQGTHEKFRNALANYISRLSPR